METLKLNQKIELGPYTYKVEKVDENYYLSHTDDSNYAIFNYLGINDPGELLKEILGYYKSGAFPECKTLEDLTLFTEDLLDRIEIKELNEKPKKEKAEQPMTKQKAFQFEEGQWCKEVDTFNFFKYSKDNEKRVKGIFHKLWKNNWRLPLDLDLIPAKPNEIEEALIEQAEKFCYPGSHIKFIEGGKKGEISDDPCPQNILYEYYTNEDRLDAHSNKIIMTIYKNGEWADIIDVSKEEPDETKDFFKEGDLVIVTKFDNKSDWKNHWFKSGEILELGGQFWDEKRVDKINNFEEFNAISKSNPTGNGMSSQNSEEFQFRHVTEKEKEYYKTVGLGANINDPSFKEFNNSSSHNRPEMIKGFDPFIQDAIFHIDSDRGKGIVEQISGSKAMKMPEEKTPEMEKFEKQFGLPYERGLEIINKLSTMRYKAPLPDFLIYGTSSEKEEDYYSPELLTHEDLYKDK